jgi:hypothetical protein
MALRTFNMSVITIDLVSYDLHITSYISSKGPEVVIAGLNPKLDMLIDTMTMFTEIPNHHVIGLYIEATIAAAISRSSWRLKEDYGGGVVFNASIIFDTDQAAEGRSA